MYLLLPIMLHSLLPKTLHRYCHFCCTLNCQKLCILIYRLHYPWLRPRSFDWNEEKSVKLTRKLRSTIPVLLSLISEGGWSTDCDYSFCRIDYSGNTLLLLSIQVIGFGIIRPLDQFFKG